MGTAGVYAVAHVDRVCLYFFHLSSAARLHKYPVPASARNIGLLVAEGRASGCELGLHLSLLGRYLYPIFIMSLL
jgi:hypothetical protein